MGPVPAAVVPDTSAASTLAELTFTTPWAQCAAVGAAVVGVVPAGTDAPVVVDAVVGVVAGTVSAGTAASVASSAGGNVEVVVVDVVVVVELVGATVVVVVVAAGAALHTWYTTDDHAPTAGGVNLSTPAEIVAVPPHGVWVIDQEAASIGVGPALTWLRRSTVSEEASPMLWSTIRGEITGAAGSITNVGVRAPLGAGRQLASMARPLEGTPTRRSTGWAT